MLRDRRKYLLYGVKKVSLLLDLYPGALAAYSVRKLRNGYDGSAIRVRRSSDNAELNIGFNGTALDTASLLSFVGAGNGFVTTWYDQSLNAGNAVATTAAAQPQIVNGGSLILENGLPALDYNGTTHSMARTGALALGENNTTFHVTKMNTANPSRNFVYFNDAANNQYFTGVGTVAYAESQHPTLTGTRSTAITTAQRLFSVTRNGSTYKIYRNGTDISTSTPVGWGGGFNSNNILYLGSARSTYWYQGLQQENIFFASIHPNRTLIEANIISHFTL